jgi:hypothetical protein
MKITLNAQKEFHNLKRFKRVLDEEHSTKKSWHGLRVAFLCDFFLDNSEGGEVTCTRTENVHLHVRAFVEFNTGSPVNSRVGESLTSSRCCETMLAA